MLIEPGFFSTEIVTNFLGRGEPVSDVYREPIRSGSVRSWTEASTLGQMRASSLRPLRQRPRSSYAAASPRRRRRGHVPRPVEPGGWLRRVDGSGHAHRRGGRRPAANSQVAAAEAGDRQSPAQSAGTQKRTTRGLARRDRSIAARRRADIGRAGYLAVALTAASHRARVRTVASTSAECESVVWDPITLACCSDYLFDESRSEPMLWSPTDMSIVGTMPMSSTSRSSTADTCQPRRSRSTMCSGSFSTATDQTRGGRRPTATERACESAGRWRSVESPTVPRMDARGPKQGRPGRRAAGHRGVTGLSGPVRWRLRPSTNALGTVAVCCQRVERP